MATSGKCSIGEINLVEANFSRFLQIQFSGLSKIKESNEKQKL